MYPGTKFAVRASNEVIRQELNFLKKDNIRISSISPGIVRSEMTANNQFKSILEAEDISSGLLYILSTPPHVQVYELILKPVGEEF